MVKQKISVTIDEDLIQLVEGILRDRSYRNRSHVIELALSKFMENENGR